MRSALGAAGRAGNHLQQFEDLPWRVAASRGTRICRTPARDDESLPKTRKNSRDDASTSPPDQARTQRLSARETERGSGALESPQMGVTEAVPSTARLRELVAAMKGQPVVMAVDLVADRFITSHAEANQP